jgi:hypothetical protein
VAGRQGGVKVKLKPTQSLDVCVTSNEIASQLFSEIHESVEREKCKTMCDMMKKILPSKDILPLHTKKLSEYIAEVFPAICNTKHNRDQMLSNRFNLAVALGLFPDASLNPESSSLEVRDRSFFIRMGGLVVLRAFIDNFVLTFHFLTAK